MWYSKPLPLVDPSSLSEVLHGFPRVDSSFNAVPNYFVPNSSKYNMSLNIISLLPVAIILLLFLILLLKSLVQISNIDEKNMEILYCNCYKQKWMYRLCKIIFYLLILCIIIEIIIFMYGLWAHTKYPVTTDMINNYRYGKTFDDKNKELLPGNAMDQLKYGTEAGVSKEDALRNKTVRPYKALFAKFISEMQYAWLQVMRPYVPPRLVETPFMKRLRRYNVSRFLKCMLLWLSGIGIILCKPHKYWVVAVIGVLWCCITSAMLMKTAVMAADICHYPGVFVEHYSDMPILRKQLIGERFYLCEQFLHECIRNKPKIRELYYKWLVILDVTHQKIIAEYDRIMLPNYQKDARHSYMYGVFQFVKECYFTHYKDVHEIGFVSCRSTIIKDEDMPVDDIDVLCRGDAIIKLLLIQLLAVMIIAVLFLLIIVIHLTKTTNIIMCKRGLFFARAKTDATVHKTRSRILYQTRLYPPTLPPEECYKTCKHYKKIMEAKQKKRKDEEDVDECKEEYREGPKKPGPLIQKKSGLMLIPPCALGRKNPCCEPVPLEICEEVEDNEKKDENR